MSQVTEDIYANAWISSAYKIGCSNRLVNELGNRALSYVLYSMTVFEKEEFKS
jgi:hypothetical protein